MWGTQDPPLARPPPLPPTTPSGPQVMARYRAAAGGLPCLHLHSCCRSNCYSTAAASLRATAARRSCCTRPCHLLRVAAGPPRSRVGTPAWVCLCVCRPSGPGVMASQGEGPQRRPQMRLGRRLEGVAKAVGGGYCRLQMPLKLAFAVRETGAGHRLVALEGRGGGALPPSDASLGRGQCSAQKYPVWVRLAEHHPGNWPR